MALPSLTCSLNEAVSFPLTGAAPQEPSGHGHTLPITRSSKAARGVPARRASVSMRRNQPRALVGGKRAIFLFHVCDATTPTERTVGPEVGVQPRLLGCRALRVAHREAGDRAQDASQLPFPHTTPAGGLRSALPSRSAGLASLLHRTARVNPEKMVALGQHLE